MPVGDDSAIYKRENIEDLLATHADAITSLREAVADEVKSASAISTTVLYDDIFLLRYIMSHKTAEAAIKPCKETLSWRIENADTLHTLTTEGIKGIPNASTFMKFQTVGEITTKFGGWTTYVVRTAHSDLPALMGAMSVEQVSDYLTYSKEINWRECDQLTRATGILVKNISVIDMNGFSFFGADKRFFKALGDSSKRSAIVFPQFLGATVIVNVPSFLSVLMKVFSPLMPQSALDKQRFCKVKNSADPIKSPASGCPYLNMFGGQNAEGLTCPVAGLPTFLGGQEPCPAALIPVADREDRLTKITVGARSNKMIEMEINSEKLMGMTFPCRLKYEILVAGYGISVGAKLKSKSQGETKEEEKVVLVARKIKAEEGLVVGTFDVLKEGTLLIEFDNTYSYLRSKTVQYRFDFDMSVTVDAGNVEVEVAF